MTCSKYQVYQAYLYGSDNMELPAKIKPKIGHVPGFMLTVLEVKMS